MNSSVQLLLVQPSVGVRHEIWCVPPIYSNLNGKNAVFFVFLINHGMECFFNKPVVFSMWEFGDASPSWSIVSGLRPPISFFFCKKLLLHTSLTCFSGAWPVMWKLKVVSFVRCYIYTYIRIYLCIHACIVLNACVKKLYLHISHISTIDCRAKLMQPAWVDAVSMAGSTRGEATLHGRWLPGTGRGSPVQNR